MTMNSPSSSALPRLLSGNELPQDAVAIDPPLSTKEVFHRKSGEDFSKKNSSLIARVARQGVPRCQPAIQWWQLELPLQRAWSFQSPQAVGSWGLDLSQE